MTFIIKKSKVRGWGYEITAKSHGQEVYHNIAPTVEAAISVLQSRYGHDVKYRIKDKLDQRLDG